MSQYQNNLVLEVLESTPNVEMIARGTKTGQLLVQPADDIWAGISGTWVTLSNATPGTGVTSQASITAYDATKDVLHLKNNSATKSYVVKYIKMFVVTAPGGSGTQKYEFRLDNVTGLSANGTALTAKRANLGVDAIGSSLVATVGAMTTVAGSSVMEKTYSGQIRDGLGAAGDTFTFLFGHSYGASGGFLLPATTVSDQRSVVHGPLVVAPGCALRMSHYGASLSTAGVYEWEIGGELRG